MPSLEVFAEVCALCQRQSLLRPLDPLLLGEEVITCMTTRVCLQGKCEHRLFEACEQTSDGVSGEGTLTLAHTVHLPQSELSPESPLL